MSFHDTIPIIVRQTYTFSPEIGTDCLTKCKKRLLVKLKAKNVAEFINKGKGLFQAMPDTDNRKKV